MNENEKETNYIEDEINIYDEKKAEFQHSGDTDRFNYNFNKFVHLICRIKNVRKHGKYLFFYDTISIDNENENKNSFFYKYQFLSYNDSFYFIKNTFNEESIKIKNNVQLIFNKKFYINEEKLAIYQNYFMNKLYKRNKEEDEEHIDKNSFYDSIKLCKKFYRDLQKNECVPSFNDDDENYDYIRNLPLLFINEYIKYENINKIIKTDSLIYLIGLPALTDTNEKSIIVFSSYLLKVSYEYFNINELLKLYEKNSISMLTLCRCLRIKERCLLNIYNKSDVEKNKYILNIVYKNKNYNSVSNQKMNNFEIFIINVIDVLPKMFKIHHNEFMYDFKSINPKNNEKVLNYFDIDIFNDNIFKGNNVEAKKKKKKGDRMFYMNNKKIPQIYWMLNQIKKLLSEIKKENTNNASFFCENIILTTGTLVNKYIESNTIIYDSYLDFLNLFIQKNNELVNDDNVKKVKSYIQASTEKNGNTFENSRWKSIEFYNITEFYLDSFLTSNKKINSKKYDYDENNNTYNLNEIYTDCNNNKKNYNYCDINGMDKENYNNDKSYNNYKLDKVNDNLQLNNQTYDFCILDVGGGKGDLGIHISLAFKNVLVIILDVNINSLFTCFTKIYSNKIKNVLVIHESILNFDFKKYKVNLIVGLHCCGGLSDYTLKKCTEEKIPFLICSCCYTKYKDLRKHIFNFKNKMVINEIQNYIYNKNYNTYMNSIVNKYINGNYEINNENNVNADINYNGDNYVINKDTNVLNSINKKKDIDLNKSSSIGNSFTFFDDKLELEENENKEKNFEKYDKYKKKIIRRIIPDIYSFVNLLSKLCESDSEHISFKCMYFYNTLRFHILQKMFYSNNTLEEKENINLSLHSFPASYSPKNIVLKGFFS